MCDASGAFGKTTSCIDISCLSLVMFIKQDQLRNKWITKTASHITLTPNITIILYNFRVLI